MNCHNNAPTAWLRGYFNIHPISAEPHHGPILQNGYYLGHVQSVRLENMLNCRDEGGALVQGKIRRLTAPFNFGYKRPEK